MADRSPVRLRVLAHAVHLRDCAARLPFRFGVHTMTEAPLLMLALEVEAEDGRRARGWAGELMVPKWFDKRPEVSVEAERAALLDALRAALAAVEGVGAPRSVFGLWQDCWAACGALAGREGGLLAGFGTALVERALLDALARLLGVPLRELLRGEATGFDGAALHPELAGQSLEEALPSSPAHELTVRHTVGLADALTEADLAGGARVDDGLPETLVEDIRHYGFDHFKIKLGGGSEEDLARLLAIAAVLAAEVPGGARYTLDANEQFGDLAELAEVLERVRAASGGADFLRGLLAIEQPLARAHSFDPQRNAAMPRVAEYAPVLIDEADGFPGAFSEALALGYRGVSFKNCKGPFRALANAMLCRARGDGAFQSAEDLTNLPVVPLQQDLCMVAALGLPHVERNGHHYFRGLAHLSEEQAAAAREAHPDLYGPFEGVAEGAATAATSGLRIRGGRLNLESLQCPGFGVGIMPDVDGWTPLPPA